ncbi:meprin A subunit beta [Lingula anatina]|uniref:Metalloendopeptidase n=1 Tax=Lingula anatina TaxID=7574 RepID=A0A1S3JM27_LINAN|nr:meprin A subunit beta [Lingula anatina]|eukprot:XP_013411465.1 meprin A subunit beta [Lingula anatina]
MVTQSMECLAVLLAVVFISCDAASVGVLDEAADLLSWTQPNLPPGVSPEEMGGKFEGDMDLDPSLFKHRNAMKNDFQRWPNGVVPYIIDSSYPSYASDIIVEAMRELEQKVAVGNIYCIRFTPRRSESDYIHVRPISGCFSGVGKFGGKQDVSLGRGCLQKGTVMHELLHTLGFHHEQSRYDRDNYVTVVYSNIQSGKESEFEKYSAGEIQHFTPYDYGSIMHYGAYYFAKDRSKPTLVAKKSGVTIGQRVGLSSSDIEDVRKFYKCTASGAQTSYTTPKPGAYLSSCTFDRNLCGWGQDRSDDMDWTLTSGSTPSSNTGPTADQSGSGKYVYVEASGYSGKTARLLSPAVMGYGSSTRYCIDFYYHMYGANMGTLKIGVKFGSDYRALTTISGDKGTRWRHFLLTANIGYSGEFNFYVEGKTGNGWRSDIAVDNIKISYGKC